MSDITLLELPFDILSKIFKSLTLAELRHVMLTCKTLKHLIEEDYTIWRANSLFVRNSLNNSQPLLSAYHLCRISRNWVNGIYKSKTLYHNTKYMPWLKFHNSDAVLLSLGSKLSCYQTNQHGIRDGPSAWNIEVPKVERNDIRTNDISRFVLKNNFIVCGNRDGCAIVYEHKGKKQRPQLLHHILDCHNEGRSEVSAVELIHKEDVFIVVTVSSNSPSLRYWNLRGNEKDNHLLVREKYHGALSTISVPSVEGFRCLALNQSQTKLAIGPNGNSKPLLLDVTTSKELSRKDLTPNIKQAVRDTQWHDENLVAYVTHAGKLQLIDTRTYDVVFDSKDPFMVTLYCVKTDGDRAILVGSAEHSRCVLYDRRNARSHVQMYFTSKRPSPIYSLDFDSTRLVAAADLSLACLNFNVKADQRRQRDYSSFNFLVV